MRKLSSKWSWLRQSCNRWTGSFISLSFDIALIADQKLWRFELGIFGLIFSKRPRICPDKIRHSAARRHRAFSSSVGCPVLGGSSLKERVFTSDRTNFILWFSRLIPEAELWMLRAASTSLVLMSTNWTIAEARLIAVIGSMFSLVLTGACPISGRYEGYLWGVGRVSYVTRGEILWSGCGSNRRQSTRYPEIKPYWKIQEMQRWCRFCLHVRKREIIYGSKKAAV